MLDYINIYFEFKLFYLDTSAGESEFDIFVGALGSSDTDKRFCVGINYASIGCGRTSSHISFADKVNMNSVGQMLEYGIRAIQTYTNFDSTLSPKPVTANTVTNMSKRQYRVPYLVYVSGTVKTESDAGVEGVSVSYCHIDRVTGQQDTDPNYCPLATFTTDKLGQWSGEIQVSDLKWTNKVENFYVTAFYNQTLKSKKFVLHTFQPSSQQVAITHLDNFFTKITDTTTITIFGSVQFDPLNMGGTYFCPFSNIPIVMVQGNGRVVNTSSDSTGSFTFSVTQSDSVNIYVPDYNGHAWRSSMSVPSLSTVDLSTSNTYSYTDAATIKVVHDFKYNPITDDGGQWIKVLEKINNVVTINAGKDVVNGVFQQYGTGNVKYIADGVVYNYYKRLTYKGLFDFYANFAVTWSNQSNVLNQDFKMYSSYTDLLGDLNPWQYCKYNMQNYGYPGYCGVNSKAAVSNMWTGFTSNTPSSKPQATEIWIQVFPYSTLFTTDLIQNGDFESFGSNFNTYDVPLGWRISSYTDSNSVATIQSPSGATPMLQGSTLDGQRGSYCGISHVLLIKHAVATVFVGINQTVYVPPGNFSNITSNSCLEYNRLIECF